MTYNGSGIAGNRRASWGGRAASYVSVVIVCGIVAAASMPGLFGCTNEGWLNITAVRGGSVSLEFVNDTTFRAFTHYVGFDPLDVDSNDFGQVIVDGGQSASLLVPCYRRFDVGTNTVKTMAEEYDPDDVGAFPVSGNVGFSSVAGGQDGELDATEGTAEGVSVLLGVDYACGDAVIFTFVQNPDAPGGFSVNFSTESSDDADNP